MSGFLALSEYELRPTSPAPNIRSMSDAQKTLNEEQAQAVNHGDGPLLIVAGAGTGKTTVLTYRYVHLLEQYQLKPQHIVALTFTEKAAQEMEDRVLELLPNGAYDFWIATFHGFCQRLLEAHGLEIGLANQFRILTDTDAWLLLKRHINELPLDHYRPIGNPLKFLRGILKHISRAKDEGITPEMYLDFAKNGELDVEKELIEDERKRLTEIAEVYAAYQQLLRDEACLDFGDVILETLRLFDQRPVILAEYQKQFQYLFIDEFQDTNWAQYELIKHLAGKRKNITVVGDDDQAIYKFRGASLANIMQFREDFPEAKAVVLTKNYRSKKEILDKAYAFIKNNNPNRLEVQLEDMHLKKRLDAVTGDGGEVNIVWQHGVDDEAEAVAEDIKKRKQQDPKASWNDFAILVRSNNTATPFLGALERAGIPFQFFALRGLYTKPVILDVMSMLQLCIKPHDSVFAWRAVHVPSFHIPAKDIAELMLSIHKKGQSIWGGLQTASDTAISDDGKKHIASLVAIFEALQITTRRESSLRLLQAVINETGYLAYIMQLPEKEKRESLHLLNAFADRVRRYEHAVYDPSLKGFLDELQSELDSGEEGSIHLDPDTGPELVKIMTLHAAKGLEFEHVYLVSLVDQRFPTRARRDDIPLPHGLVQERLPEGDYHLEEERRLFYVGMTRAKQSLSITGAKQYGGAREKKPSVFINECELTVPEVVETAEHQSKQLQLVTREAEAAASDKIIYALKKRFSFTQLAAFKKCPLQYKFEHVYRIPKFGNENKSFGQSVHLTLQQIMDLHVKRREETKGGPIGEAAGRQPTEGLLVSREEAAALYENSWIDEWYKGRDQHKLFKEKGMKIIDRLLHAYGDAAPNVRFIELPFTLVFGQHSIKGKVDRVDALPDGTFAIYDYKTGTVKQELTAGEKEQLYIYQLALEEQGMKVSQLAYIYAAEWVVTEVNVLAGKKREAFIEKIMARMDAIVTSDFQATPQAFVCRYCDFKDICEFKK